MRCKTIKLTIKSEITVKFRIIIKYEKKTGGSSWDIVEKIGNARFLGFSMHEDGEITGEWNRVGGI